MKHPVVIWLTGCAVALTGAKLAAEDRPNVVICVADDQGWGDMAYNGHPHLKTPAFDEMARTGLRLDRFYAAAPVCSPTRGSVLTGRTPNRYGVFSWGHSLRPQEVTLAEVLGEAGYATGHFGKWHLGSTLPDSPLSPGAQGFHEWVSAPNFFDLNPWLSRQGKAERHEGESSEIVVNEALRFIRGQANAQRPFLAVICFGSPHGPHRGLERDVALYQDAPEKQRHFLAEITAMDRAMGNLRRGLRDAGIADDTLLWYCSDNGAIAEGSTGGLRGRKGTLYDGGLRVPCLIEWPARVKSPMRIDLPACTVDIFPTVLDVAGIKRTSEVVLDGQSLNEMFNGSLTERTRPLGFWQAAIGGFSTPSDKILADVAAKQRAGEPVDSEAAIGLAPAPLEWNAPADSYSGHAAWLEHPWKLHRIEDKRRRVQWELYNLADDPDESENRATSEPARFATMQTALDNWLQSVTASLRGEDYH